MQTYSKLLRHKDENCVYDTHSPRNHYNQSGACSSSRSIAKSRRPSRNAISRSYVQCYRFLSFLCSDRNRGVVCISMCLLLTIFSRLGHNTRITILGCFPARWTETTQCNTVTYCLSMLNRNEMITVLHCISC